MDDEEAVSKVIDLLSGKWTVKVFFLLEKQPKTFTTLNKQIDEISNKMLSKTLNKLKSEGVVAEAESVNGYILTKKGFELKKNLEYLVEWSNNYSGSSKKVLIVEDDFDQAKMYSKWLNDFETKIVEPELLLEETKSEVLAVIMDRYLEDQESDKYLKYLSEAGIPVLICTGVEPQIQDTEMSFYDYLVKPLDRNRLKDSLNEIKEHSRDNLNIKALKNKKELIRSRNLGSSHERDVRLKELDDKLDLDS